MPADVASSLKNWSTTAGSNSPAGSTAISTNLDDNLREIQKVVRAEVANSTTLASGATTDLGSVDSHVVNVTGTTTITGLGTVDAGIRRKVWFSGALTLTHNGTSLILPTASNITTAAGDSAEFVSLGSGNWRCLWFQRASAVFPTSLSSGLFLTNNGTTLSWSTPAASLSSLTSATASGSLTNGDNPITWQWAPTTNSRECFRLAVTSQTGTGQVLTELDGVRGLDSVLDIRSEGATIARFLPGGIQLTPAVGDAQTAGAGRSITISASNADNATSNVNGGSVTVTAGASGGGSGVGGSVTLQPGQGLGGASADGALVLQNARNTIQFRLDGSTANISSGGGAGATIRGTDHFFEVTFGTGSPTSVVVGFDNALAAAPMCLLSGTQAGQVLTYSATTTGVTISSGTAFSSGTKVTCIVIVAS